MSDNETFGDFVTREKQRLDGEREIVAGKMAELQDQLDGLNRQYRAIDAYIATLEEKPAPFAAQRGRSNGSTAPGPRSREGSRREQLMTLIANQKQGVARGEILTLLNLKGDRKGEMAVSNALTALTKNNSVIRREGKYHAVQAG